MFVIGFLALIALALAVLAWRATIKLDLALDEIDLLESELGITIEALYHSGAQGAEFVKLNFPDDYEYFEAARADAA